MTIKAERVFKLIEELAPRHLAEKWDNCGIQVGSGSQTVSGILVCLDLDETAIDEAEAAGANLIISHHPLLFDGLKKIDYDDYRGNLIRRLIEAGISVYSAHTNLDSASEGLNQFLALKIGLRDVVPLGKTAAEDLFKLVVYVPEHNLEAVRRALSDAGAGQSGNYNDCSFRHPGIGAFRPLEGSNPYLGTIGVLEEASEYRLEVLVQQSKLEKAVGAMIAVHPYEEPAYDIIPLANPGRTFSYGRLGWLPQAIQVSELAELIKRTFGLPRVAVAGRLDQEVQKIALVSGSGASMIGVAVKEKCDVIVTGDIKYHEAMEAAAQGMIVIDAGHDGLELNVVDLLVPFLSSYAQGESWGVRVTGHRSGLLWTAI